MVTIGWRKSTASGADACCVWVDIGPDEVRVGGDPVVAGTGTSPVLHFTHPEWAAFLVGAKAGEFDLDG